MSSPNGMPSLKVILFANTDWYLYNFRLSLALSLRDAGHDVLLISPPGPYGEKLQNSGLRWVPAPMERRSLNPLREIALLWWLWRLMAGERPDIVHGFTIKCAVYGAVVGRLVGAGRINAITGMGYVFANGAFRAQLLRPIVRSLMRLALGGKRGRLILQNRDDVRFFEHIGIRRELIRLIPGSGVDCSRFVERIDGAADGMDAFRVLLAARLLWDKGVAEYVEAARILKAENRSIRFLLAGLPDPGNPASVPEQIIRDWHRTGLVQWLGHVTDMPALFAGADVVVLPSYREGFPKSLIEAAACAKPLVTTDVPGCREAVTDGVNGLLVPARDAKALALAIARLQDDPVFARDLGLVAREKALSEFDERIVISRTVAVYREIVKASS